MAITADYYVDPENGSDGNGGASTGDAWATLQYALDNAGADQLIACRHYASPDETLAASINMDVSANQRIIGVNGSWEDDGTRYELDGNSAAANGLDLAGTSDEAIIINFEIYGTTSSGINLDGGVDRAKIIDTYIHDCGSYGVQGAATADNTLCFRVIAENNSSEGIRLGIEGLCILCRTNDNSNSGIGLQQNGSEAILCLSYENGAQGVSGADVGYGVFFCTCHANVSYGINNGAQGPVAMYNRVTGHAGAGDIGIRFTDNGAMEDWNYVQGNDTDISNSGYSRGNSVTVGTDGYTNAAGGIFTLLSTATWRNLEVVIDSLNSTYMGVGAITPEIPAGGGGSRSRMGTVLGTKKGAR